MKSDYLQTGKEVFFDESEIIVSKTDLGGRITYANDVFLRVAGYREDEIIGRPHSLIRHPDMPRCVFKLLWDTLQSGSEVFAYVVNLCSNGDYYWVLAHVTPSFDAQGAVIGYHSNRRVPDRQAVEDISRLYSTLRAEEEKTGRSIEGMQSAFKLLSHTLADLGVDYDEFVFSLAA